MITIRLQSFTLKKQTFIVYVIIFFGFFLFSAAHSSAQVEINQSNELVIITGFEESIRNSFALKFLDSNFAINNGISKIKFYNLVLFF